MPSLNSPFSRYLSRSGACLPSLVHPLLPHLPSSQHALFSNPVDSGPGFTLSCGRSPGTWQRVPGVLFFPSSCKGLCFTVVPCRRVTGRAAVGPGEADRSQSQLCDLRKGICYSEPLLPIGHIDPHHVSQTVLVPGVVCVLQRTDAHLEGRRPSAPFPVWKSQNAKTCSCTSGFPHDGGAARASPKACSYAVPSLLFLQHAVEKMIGVSRSWLLMVPGQVLTPG